MPTRGRQLDQNGRDSESKRLVKKADGQYVLAGNIITAEGTAIRPAECRGRRDHTLFALIDGRVKFEYQTKDKKQVSVYSAG